MNTPGLSSVSSSSDLVLPCLCCFSLFRVLSTTNLQSAVARKTESTYIEFKSSWPSLWIDFYCTSYPSISRPTSPLRLGFRPMAHACTKFLITCLQRHLLAADSTGRDPGRVPVKFSADKERKPSPTSPPPRQHPFYPNLAMHPSSYPFLLSLLLLLLLLRPPPATAGLYTQVCNYTSKFSADSTYQSNLDRLLSSLPSNASSAGGFSASTAGAVPDLVSALALCRGDLNASACSTCLSDASSDASRLCPYDRSATIFYDLCLLRYSDQRFLSSPADNSPVVAGYSVNNVSNPARFHALIALLMNATADWAAYNSSRRYATGEAVYGADGIAKVYGLAQCTPDLAAGQCRKCLREITSELDPSFYGRQGARIVGVRCNLRYESNPFYNGAAAVQLVSPAGSAAGPAPTPGPAPPVAPAPTSGSATPAAAASSGGRAPQAAVGVGVGVLLMTLAL